MTTDEIIDAYNTGRIGFEKMVKLIEDDHAPTFTGSQWDTSVDKSYDKFMKASSDIRNAFQVMKSALNPIPEIHDIADHIDECFDFHFFNGPNVCFLIKCMDLETWYLDAKANTWHKKTTHYDMKDNAYTRPIDYNMAIKYIKMIIRRKT